MSVYGDRQYIAEVSDIDAWYERERMHLNAHYFLGDFDSVDEFNDARTQLACEAADKLTAAHRVFLDRNPDAAHVIG